MKLHLPNSAFLGNIEAFISKLNSENPCKRKISLNPKWVSVHPAVLTATAALALECRDKGISVFVDKEVPIGSIPQYVWNYTSV